MSDKTTHESDVEKAFQTFLLAWVEEQTKQTPSPFSYRAARRIVRDRALRVIRRQIDGVLEDRLMMVRFENPLP